MGLGNIDSSDLKDCIAPIPLGKLRVPRDSMGVSCSDFIYIELLVILKLNSVPKRANSLIISYIMNNVICFLCAILNFMKYCTAIYSYLYCSGDIQIY